MRTQKTKWSVRFGFLLLLVYPLAGWGETPTATPHTPEPITVNDTNKSIRVDGYLVDWPVTRMILLNQKSQVTYGILNWKTKDDFSGRVFLTYDAQYLYLSAIIQKSSGVVNSNGGLSLWDGDCIELFLSAYSVTDNPSRISKSDYHIGFSPGSGCGNPQMFCFNKEKRIGGGRINARSTGHGYILEACVPLTFFEGLEIGPGKKTRFNLALDEGGSASGNRMLQLDLTGNPQSWQNPSLWGSIQWIGKTEVSVPKNEEDNLYANLVTDGTKSSTYWGRRTITGSVVDVNGKPILGALISTWPKTKTVSVDKEGRFELDKVKTYDKTVIYARRDGYGTSLIAIDRKLDPVTVCLKSLPQFLTSEDAVGSAFYGQSFQVPADGDLLGLINRVQEWIKPLSLNVLKLVGTELLGKKQEDQFQALDRFVGYARSLGAEPMIELPIEKDNSSAAEWVRHCNVDKNEHVAYWTIGDEPDLYAEKRIGSEFADYNVYDYINDFRVIFNSAKAVDPSVLILGPELAWRYTSAEDDWLTPFIQFDGDIVNLVSVHHYGAIKAVQCNPGSVLDDVRHMQTLTRDLKSRIAINSDIYIPLVITGGNVCMESTDNTIAARVSPTVSSTVVPTVVITTKKAFLTPTPTPQPPEDVGPNSFWAAVWEADQAGTLMEDHMPMAFFSYLGGNGALDFFNARGAKPDYWVLRLMSTYMKGKVIWAQVQNGNASVYATQDPKTKDVSLLIMNKGSNYYHPKILLNAKDANISVDAGLDQVFDFEMPYYSIAVMTIKADKSHDEVVLYTKKMAQAGKPPEVSVIKPW
jgi:hypothetical protein